jgi:hypothetical protein
LPWLPARPARLQVLSKGRPEDGWPGIKDKQVGGQGQAPATPQRCSAALPPAALVLPHAMFCHGVQKSNCTALLYCPLQVPLRDDQTYIPGLYNGQGTKVSWQTAGQGALLHVLSHSSAGSALYRHVAFLP